MMNVKDAILTRRAKRVLSDAAVTDDTLQELIEAMRLAPSCNNYQPWRVLIAHTPEALAKMKSTLTKGNVWATRAQIIMAVCARRDDDCKLSDNRDYFLFGCGLAIGEMMLRATELGLIAHPIAGYDPLLVKQDFGIPSEYIVIALVNIGYPGEDASLLSEKQKLLENDRPARKPVAENFFDGAWGQGYVMKG